MDGATRIWLDDPNPIFRMGLAAALRDPRFVVVGESTGFVPTPTLEDIDVLVFDLGDARSLGLSLPRRQRRSTRLVGLVPAADIESAERSQCTILVRSELTPEGFRDCLASVVAGGSAPTGSSARRPASAGAQPLRARGVSPRQRRREPHRSADSSPVGSVQAALAGVGSRLRQLAKRKGALFLVAAALAAGAFGPTNRAEGLSGSTAPVAPDAVRSGFSVGGPTVTLAGTAGREMSFFRLDFICQDGDNTSPGLAGRQNFKHVRLDRVLDASNLPT